MTYKPRLFSLGGIWICLSYAVYGIGYGKTPEEAYRDWDNKSRVSGN